MRYVTACLEDYKREMAYRIYVTESLRYIPQETWSKKSFCDIINEISQEKQEEVDGDKLAFDIIMKAGLSFGE